MNRATGSEDAMRRSSVGALVGLVAGLGLLAGCGLSGKGGPTGASEVPSFSEDAAPVAVGEETGGVTASAVATTGVSPIRPVSGAVTLSYNKVVSWATKPHNGIDYRANLWTPIRAVGSGMVFSYTKPYADRFGSISPNGNGPAIWIKHTLQDGSPIYVLYGHTAFWWTNRSTTKNGRFTFSCDYGVINQRPVAAGEVIGYTAPFYNGGQLATHLHLSVFKPNRLSNGQYAIPPSSGWGYSDTWTSQGQYIDPEAFLRSYKLKR
jgi:murein DD-endopeptidase MepM/ murein hydrolase activator NlpD